MRLEEGSIFDAVGWVASLMRLEEGSIFDAT